MNLLLPLLITLAIETGIYMILKHRDLKLFITVSFLNVVLNMSMNIGLSMIRDTMTYWIVLSICEVATVLIEALLIHLIMKFSFKHTLLFALIANAASFLVGFLLTLTPVYEIQMAMIILCIVFGLVYLFTYGFILVSFIKAKNNAF